MSTSTSTEVSLEKKLQQFEEQLMKADKPSIEQFRQAYQELRKLSRKLQELLQWISERHRSEKEFENLYRQIAGWNASELIERLKRTGLAFKQDRDLKDAFDRQGYRLLELVRTGARDEVFHSILRIFVSAKKKFPDHLVEAFKPIYSDELFKILLFSFLSGILGKEQEDKQ
jgi:inorganic triphosphatase YgiF